MMTTMLLQFAQYYHGTKVHHDIHLLIGFNGKAFNLSTEKLLHDLKHEGQYYGLLLRFDLYDTKYIHGYII